ncbi:MAG TPA: hypothetical protein ENI63_01795 [Candidatus Kaiserbacteria bacterium]|nr:hypothetical protein [Candidatus Kaiserbacteria bacterium]
MVYIIVFEPSSIILMSLWVVVLSSFLLITNKKRENSLYFDTKLRRYFIYITVLLFIFYFLSFARVGDISLFPSIDIFRGFFNSSFVYISAFLLTFLGAFMMIVARWQLHSLSMYEVFFANSQLIIKNGIYRYFKHPMYVGIFLIMIGSLLLYPNVYAFFIGIVVCILIVKKAQRENSL